MNGVRPLVLILAALAVSVALASMWPHLAGGQRGLPAEVVEGAPLQQQDCDDDVSITVEGVYDLGNLDYSLNDPPDYAAGDSIWIGYTVTNTGCHDVKVTVAFTGSKSGKTIHVESSSADPCATECTVLATGGTGIGWDQWNLSKHPNATDEKVVATVTVTAPADFADVNTENNSATSEQWINIVNEVPAPDIVLKSVTASKDTVVVGETITFTVTVQNEGDADAETKVILDHGADTAELDSKTVSVLADGPEQTVTLSWDTNGAEARDHQLRILAQTEGDSNPDNDSGTVTVTLLQPTVDAAVKSVKADPTEAMIGEPITFTVTLENAGNVVASWPNLLLFDADAAEDAEPLASQQANTSIAVGDEVIVEILWNTSEAVPGERNLRVLAQTNNDDNPDNDRASVAVTLIAPVDVAVGVAEPLAVSAIAGNLVTVPFTVTNSSEHDTGEVTVSLYVRQSDAAPERGEPTDTATLSALAVGKSEPGALTWDTSTAAMGDYELEVVAETAGDTDESNNSITASIEIRNWLLLKNVSAASAAAVSGDTVEFTAQVENVGQGEVTGATVGLYESGTDDALADVDFASIAAGDKEDVTIRWDTAGRDVGQVELFIVAGADGQTSDRDDSQWVSVTIRNPIALSSAMPASDDNVAGLPVTINVQVLNESVAEVAGIEVKLDTIENCDNKKEDEEGEKASGCATIAAIPAGGTGAAVLEWDTAGVEPDKHELKIVASAAGYSADPNDATSLTIELRDPVTAVELAAASISRNIAAVGQTLMVTATIANHGEVPIAVPVSLYTVGNQHDTTDVAMETSPLTEPGSTENVELQWHTTGETSGIYDLRVSVDVSGDTTLNDNTAALAVELFHSAFEGDDAPKSCLEDVRVTVDEIRDKSGLPRSPPNYQVGENLRAVYTVDNYSCDTDVAAAITMTGPGDQAITDPATLCFSNCAVPFGGRVEGEVAWIIPTLSALSDQPITATVAVASPNDFTDINEANNSAESTDRVNIVHPGDILLDLGEETGNKVSTRRTLAGPEFGTVDVSLVSASPLQTSLPFAAATVEVVVEVANDGPTTEPAVIRFVLAADDGTDPLELHRHTMVIPTAQNRTENVAVPLRDVPPGVHTVAVLLSAAVDQSSENNAAAVEITRADPLVNVEMLDVSVSPDVLILGDDATVSLEVRNASEIPLPLSLELYVDDDAEPTGRKAIDELAPDGQSEEQIDWRVPASALMLGQHTLRLIASSEEFGTVANTDKDVTFHIDAEILRINASPTETAMRGEEVAIKVEVQNNGPATVNVPVTLYFPSDAKNPKTDHALTPARSTGTASFTWNTRNYADDDHTLTVKVPDEHNIATGETSMELPFRLTPLVVTATIVDVWGNPETPSVGEPVWISVTVRNDGPVAASIPVTLHFPPGGRKPDSKKPHLNPGEMRTVVFEWLTSNYRTGTHRFLTEVAAVNSPRRHFTIDLLPTIENVAIVGMGTYPAETAMVGEPVEVWVDVHNDGPLAINVPVRLTFPSASKLPETPSPRVDPGETTRVWFEWRTSNYEPGDHTLTAAILLDNNITLGPTTDEIGFTLTPLIINATIMDVSVNPKEPRVGDPVAITVTVRNDGPIAASIPVTLHFPSSDKRPETTHRRIDPRATGTIAFTWHTGHYEPGMHAFRVEVASDPPISRQFNVELLPPIVNVAIVGISSDPADTAVQGQQVKISVDVINNGPSALNVPVQLAFPSDEKLLAQKSSRIEPGKTARVEFVWKTANYDVGTHLLTATLLADYNIAELDTSAMIQIALVPAQLTASIVDISWSPNSPSVGEPVQIAVTVRNDGLVAARIPVTLHFPSADKQSETRSPRADPGQTETATFDWLTGNYAVGTHQFRVELADVDVPDQPFTIDLLPTIENAAIVGMGTYPADTAMVGEPVEVWIDVRNDGPVAVNVPVRLTFPSASRRPEAQSPRVDPGETARVWFEWKTSNYNPGIHTLRATILLDNNITLGRTTEEIRFALTPLIINATIVEVAVNPQQPRVGEPATITVTVRNDGRIATNIPVTLHFPPGGRQSEPRSPRVDVGETGEAVFTWRTSHYEPGMHAFRVEVASDPPISRQFNVELLPPIVNVAIVGISSDPADTAVQGQQVKISVDVINNGPSALNVPVQLAFPSDEKLLAQKSSRIEPGKTARVEFVWKTANYDVGTHLLTATLLADYNIAELDTSAMIQIALVPAQLTASIIDISWSPNSPSVGEPVQISVTVRNDGPVATSIPVTLHFPSADKQSETRSLRADPGQTKTAMFDWLTGNYAAGTHQFRVELADVDVPDQPFTIDLLPTIENAAIVGMGTYPADTAMVGEPVEVWIDVRNDGPVAVNVPVRLTFPSAGKLPETPSPRVEPGETKRVFFEWRTSNYEPGDHTLTAAILLDNNITLGPTTDEIGFTLTPLIINATIMDVSVNPKEPRVGDPVAITVTVRNDGPIAASIPVTLHFPSSDKRPETTHRRIDPRATGTIAFTWHTGRYQPGAQAFVVEVASEPPSAHEFTIELLPPIVNVAIVGMGSNPSESAVRGQAVKIWVDVINNGPSALNVPVQLSFPSSDKQPQRKSPRIEPGAIARIEFTWKTVNYDTGEHLLTATLMAEHNITELAISATIQIRLVSPRLAASIVDISWHPASPVVGEPVSITVTVRNNGSITANIPVKLYFPSGNRQPQTRRPRVAPGAVGSADFTWRTSRYEPGDHVFRVQIPGVAGAVKTFEIELRPPEVDFAIVDVKAPDPLHPFVKGDWVEITVVVQNRGPYAGRGKVYLLDAADLDTMYEQSASIEPGELREVEFTWKTLRYPVGEYGLLARVDAEHDTDPDNDESDRMPFHLLNDRDITVGFGNDVRPAVFAETTSKVGLSSMPRYLSDIAVVGNGHTPVDRPIAAASDLSMGVSPQPTSGNYDPARMYWRWRAAQVSTWECARYQQAIGENLPRAIVCPKAPALVR